ncbi:hypothetical protein FRB99_004922 [Tulasnella sp. 403]|nr:hypothetical protein FRB99_004922 [Tulasnella sp. 403]
MSAFVVEDPFTANSPGDCILRTPCGTQFKVFRGVLIAASPVFRTMFDLPQPPTLASTSDKGDPPPVIDVTETAEVMQELLKILYPLDLVQLKTVDLVIALVDAWEKYELPMSRVMAASQHVLQNMGDYIKDIIKIYTLTWRLKAEEDAKKASRYMHHIDLHNPSMLQALTTPHGNFLPLTQLLDLKMRRERHVRFIMDTFNFKRYLCRNHNGSTPKVAAEFEQLLRTALDVPYPVCNDFPTFLRLTDTKIFQSDCEGNRGCFGSWVIHPLHLIHEMSNLVSQHPQQINGFPRE